MKIYKRNYKYNKNESMLEPFFNKDTKYVFKGEIINFYPNKPHLIRI
jgi:hypothetical protein